MMFGVLLLTIELLFWIVILYLSFILKCICDAYVINIDTDRTDKTSRVACFFATVRTMSLACPYPSEERSELRPRSSSQSCKSIRVPPLFQVEMQTLGESGQHHPIQLIRS